MLGHLPGVDEGRRVECLHCGHLHLHCPGRYDTGNGLVPPLGEWTQSCPLVVPVARHCPGMWNHVAHIVVRGSDDGPGVAIDDERRSQVFAIKSSSIIIAATTTTSIVSFAPMIQCPKRFPVHPKTTEIELNFLPIHECPFFSRIYRLFIPVFVCFHVFIFHPTNTPPFPLVNNENTPTTFLPR